MELTATVPVGYVAGVQFMTPAAPACMSCPAVPAAAGRVIDHDVVDAAARSVNVPEAEPARPNVPAAAPGTPRSGVGVIDGDPLAAVFRIPPAAVASPAI